MHEFGNVNRFPDPPPRPATQAAGGVISLPQGGGAIGGIGETFKPNLFAGTRNKGNME